MKQITFSSYLLTFVAILCMGTAFGQSVQNKGAWPSAIPPGVVISDSIYTCISSDRGPIELAYDVPGKFLSVDLGSWEMVAFLSFDGSENGSFDYTWNVANGNGGAGNVFNQKSATIGAYLMEYTASDATCGIAQGEKVWVFVFIMPDVNDLVTHDTVFCVNPTGSFTPGSVSKFFSNRYESLYTRAGLKVGYTPVDWNVPFSLATKRDTTYVTAIKVEDIVASKGPIARGLYTCGAAPDPVEGKPKSNYQLNVKIVDDTEALTPKKNERIICSTDRTIDSRTIGTVLNRPISSGTAQQAGAGYYANSGSSSRINYLDEVTWTGLTTAGGNEYALVDYRYSVCGSDKIVTDTLIRKTGGNNEAPNVVTAEFCGLGTDFETNLYHFLAVNGPLYSIGDLLWEDNGFSADLVNDPTPKHGAIAKGYHIDASVMKPNIEYYFKWTQLALGSPAFDCGVGTVGGLRLLKKSAAQPRDYRFQVCQSNNELDFASILKMPATTTWSSTSSYGANGKFMPDLPGVYKLIYNTPKGECSGGSGNVYVKVGGNVVIPSSINEKFCVDVRPQYINLFELIGYYEEAATWSVSAVDQLGGITLGAVSGLLNPPTEKSGHFNLSGLGQNTGSVTFELTGASCITGMASTDKLTLKIEIVDAATFNN